MGSYRVAAALLAVAVASGIVALSPAVAQSPSPPADRSKPAPSHPMVFYLAKGAPDACGVGCSEWIVADGDFERNGIEAFRALLKRVGDRRLPV